MTSFQKKVNQRTESGLRESLVPVCGPQVAGFSDMDNSIRLFSAAVAGKGKDLRAIGPFGNKRLIYLASF
jgi:hypothetical protein